MTPSSPHCIVVEEVDVEKGLYHACTVEQRVVLIAKLVEGTVDPVEDVQHSVRS